MGHHHPHSHPHGHPTHGPPTHAHEHHGHTHGGHAHGEHAHGLTASRAIGWALLLNGLFLFIELFVGWWSGSLALLSDAAHMVSDVGSLVLALAAARIASQAVTSSTTYGLARAEVLGAFLNGLLLVGAALWIVFEAVHRLLTGAPEVEGMPVLIVGVAGLAINLGSAFILHRADGSNLNVRGALLHMLADALGSAAAIAAAVLLMFDVHGADPVASLIVAVLVAIGAVRLLRDAGRVLLELPPEGFDVVSVREALTGIEGVIEVHDLHAWSLDGRHPLVSAHLVVAEEAAPLGICRHARAMLHTRFGIGHATLQIESSEECQTHCERPSAPTRAPPSPSAG